MGTFPIPLAGQFQGSMPWRSSFQADEYDNERATSQTVQAMCGHIRQCASDPYVRWAAQDALKTWGNRKGVMPSAAASSSARSSVNGPRGLDGAPDPARAAWSCWWWVKSNLHFTQDDDQLLRLLNEQDQLELLIAPSVMLRSKARKGDCDDYTMLLCSMLQSLGGDWRIVTVACDPSDPSRWSHVYAGCLLPSGLLSLDASHGQFPGWRIPNERTYRLQVWNQDGTKDGPEQKGQTGMGGIRGLHGYRRGLGAGLNTMVPVVAPSGVVMMSPPIVAAPVRTPNGIFYINRPGQRRGIMRGIRRRGVGQDDGTTVDTTSILTDPSIPVLPSGSTIADLTGSSGTMGPTVLPTVSQTATSTTGNNAALDSFLASLATQWTKIAGQTIAPQTTIQGPGYSITGPSGAIASTSIPALSVGGLNLNSLMLVAIIGVGAIILINATKK